MNSSALLFDNVSRIRESFSFVMRGAVVSDKSALAFVSAPSALTDTDLFDQYGISVSNVGLNTWPLFYNTERYLLSADSSWEAASAELPEIYFNLFSSRASWLGLSSAAQYTPASLLGLSASSTHVTPLPASPSDFQYGQMLDNVGPRAGVLLGALGDTSGDVTYANGLDRSFWADSTTSLNQVNTSWLSQLVTYTAPDTTNLFYMSSLLVYEDWGLNFAPGVKELVQKTFSYTTYQHNALLSQFSPKLQNQLSLHNNLSDVYLGTSWDLATRLYTNSLTSTYQAQPVTRAISTVTDSSLATQRSS